MVSKFLWRLGGWLGLPLLAYGIAVAVAHPAPPHPFIKKLPTLPLRIAHRGGAGIWPENTRYALERAARLGVDMVELDTHASADGVLVVMHDATVDRTTNGTGLIRQKTLAELKTLDAGYRWTDDDGRSFPFRGQGITVPTLEEIFQTLPQMPMIIEIKQAEPSIVDALCGLIRRYGRQEDVIIGSFHVDVLREMRQRCPEVATSAHTNEVRLFLALNFLRLTKVYSPAPLAFQVPTRQDNIEIVTPSFVRSAHERGMQIHTWTVNDPAEMEYLLSIGVDGIITDRPDRFMELLVRSQKANLG
ncbi:MAG: glycerophosphodiester phosphodiesterase [Caldilineaceae bacterium]|nr:glycerophosphodiester phosphodiesterase [Caldilineaceae bacterium]